jgi:hypothetical protein
MIKHSEPLWVSVREGDMGFQTHQGWNFSNWAISFSQTGVKDKTPGWQKTGKSYNLCLRWAGDY